MPHQFIEYSANLDATLTIQDLVDTMHGAAADCGVFPLAGLRTRAVRREHYAIADRHPDNAFVNVYLRVGPRSDTVLAAASDRLFDALCDYLQPLLDQLPLAISFEIQQLPVDRRRKSNLREHMQRRGTFTPEE